MRTRNLGWLKRGRGCVAGLTLGLWCLAVAAEPREFGYDADGCITINGERSFILGTYHAGNRHTEPEATLETYRDLRAAGFNLVHAGDAQMDLAHEAGLLVWTTVGTVDLENEAESREQLRARVDAVRAHPALAFYEQVDEPAWIWIGDPNFEPGKLRVQPEQFHAAYEIIKEADPHRLIYTNHAPTNLVSTMQRYNAGTDIVAMDIYPVNPGGLKFSYALFPDGYQGDLNDQHISQVGRYVDKMREVAGPSRPLFMVLQAFAWEMLTPEAERREEKILYPTHAQSRLMAFQSVIKGANGIIYWGSHYTPQPSEAWTGVTRVVRELADLAPVIAQQATPLELEIAYHEIGYGVDYGIQYRAWEHEGSLYLLSCNPDKHPNRATLSGLGNWSRAALLQEGEEVEEVATHEGGLTDTWQRFDVRVYRLSE